MNEHTREIVGKLQLAIINRGCRAAYAQLVTLLTEAQEAEDQELIEEITQEDFLNIQLYEGLAIGHGDLCACCHPHSDNGPPAVLQ